MKVFRISMLVRCLLLISGLGWGHRSIAAEESASGILYVSPSGDDGWEGSLDRPLATVRSALARLPESAGTIELLSGRYTEAIVIPSTGGSGRLILRAVTGADVVFDGSVDIEKWEAWNSIPGLYRAELPVNTSKTNINLWEEANRVRYQRQVDPRGVRAWPGSFCVMDDGHLLVQTSDGKDPGALHVRISRTPIAVRVERSDVAIQNIRFKNYLGASNAAAIQLLSSRKNLQVTGCKIENTVRGILIQAKAEDVEVAWCFMNDVGTGVFNMGLNVDVHDCVIQAAVGAFAIEQELNLYEHNGLRFYHPAQGGKISNCITGGFWAGLYLKTGGTVEYGTESARPFMITHNTFTDGIRRGSASQESARYFANITAGGKESLESLQMVGADLEANYFFDASLPATGDTKRSIKSMGSNLVGPAPFVDLRDGNLAILPEITLPTGQNGHTAGANTRQVSWTPELAASFAPFQNVVQGKQKKLKVEFVSSLQGAVITATLESLEKSRLRYRRAGENRWSEISAASNSSSNLGTISQIVGESAEGTQESSADVEAVFVLSEKLLLPNKEYEFQVEETEAGGKTNHSNIQRFTTRGAPKEIHVSAGAEMEGADGSKEHPFPEIQVAFNHALPGDTLLIAEGIYTTPATLTHGGSEALPIVIQGAGENETVLDGGMITPAFLELRGANNVIIRDLQVRWFEKTGIAAIDCEQVSIERCRFFNREITTSQYPNGSGIVLKNSPGSAIINCTFTRLIYGFQAIDSPGIIIRNNTAFKNLYASGNLVRSSRDSVVTYNSFTFANIASLIIRESNDKAFASLDCDFNNYATWIGNSLANQEKLRPETNFQIPERYGKLNTSKRIIDRIHSDGKNRERFYRMGDWSEASGKDQNSIFADPKYADPLKGDFRLLTDSPNIMEQDGQQVVIGAAPMLEATAKNAK